MNCPNCNAEIEDNSKYCKECGGNIQNTAIPRVVMPETALPSAPPQKKLNKMRLALICGAGAVVLIGALITLFVVTRPANEPLRVENDQFLINVSEYKKRFNSEVSGSLAKIKEFDHGEVYGMATDDVHLEPNITLTVMSDLETKNVLSVMLDADIDTEDKRPDLVEKYMLCVFHSCDPTATVKDNTDFLRAMWNTKFNQIELSLESKFYRLNGIAYKLEMNLSKITFIVLPD